METLSGKYKHTFVPMARDWRQMAEWRSSNDNPIPVFDIDHFRAEELRDIRLSYTPGIGAFIGKWLIVGCGIVAALLLGSCLLAAWFDWSLANAL